MKKTAVFILALFVMMACSKDPFMFPLKSTAMLKDKKTVQFELEIICENADGIQEFKKKEKKIIHAVRLIIAQRTVKHLKNAGRLKSILKKVFKSQLKNKVKGIRVKSFKVE